ncbi:MAG: type I secretion system permease/ATPase [Burkholderiales bacterium]|nr:type I secretion system permease/ATPase [Burkholderiales bacterium]
MAGKGPHRSAQDRSVQDPLALAARELRPALVAVFVFSLFINLLVFIPSIYMLQVYDRVMTSRNETTLLMISAIVVALLVSYATLEHLRSRILVQAGLRLDEALSGPTFGSALEAALRQRGSHHAQALRDVDAVRDFVGGSGIITLLDAPWVPIFLAVCFLFHPLIGLVAAVGAGSLFVITFLNETLTRKPLIKASLMSIASHERLSASLRNAEAIRGLGMAGAVRARWQGHHRDAVDLQVTAGETGGLLLAASKVLRLMLQVGILGVGAWLAIRQEISPGVMFAASLIMGRALSPLEQAIGQWRSFVTARAARQRLARLFTEHPPRPARTRLPAPQGRLAVENLAVLAPATQTPVVRRVGFELEPGDVLAVVGPTGSGKSSLARAIVNAWPAAAGCVRIDGNDVTHYDPDQFGAAIGYLPQDIELFAGSIAENIARFGARDDAAVVAAATAAQAHGLIQRLPGGYETVVGEDGVGLSGGQKQRLALARALYGAPRLVVLDEPNSNLDGEGDAALVAAVAGLKARGATVVIITHKPNLLGIVDKVLVMHEGEGRKIGLRDEMLPLILGSNVAGLMRGAQQTQAA